MSLRSLWTAAVGMESQALNMDVIANNLANVNTSGFKRSRTDFQDLFYQNLRIAGAASSSGTEIPTSNQIGLGTKVAAVAKIGDTGIAVTYLAGCVVDNREVNNRIGGVRILAFIKYLTPYSEVVISPYTEIVFPSVWYGYVRPERSHGCYVIFR